MVNGELSPEEMLEIVRRHDAAEAAGDVEAVMSTVAEKPFYEFNPLGYRITSREAVAEMYRRVLPAQRSAIGAAKQVNLWFNEDGYAAEYQFVLKDSAGMDRRSSVIAAFTFEGRLVKSERAFLDPQFTTMFDAALGADFPSLPGVTVEEGQ